MANKKQTNKRRVAAAEQEDRRQTAAAKQDRRRQLMVGGVIAFLALALIAPLTAGLIGTVRDDDPVLASTTTTTAPVPLDLPWVSPEFAGATIVGPTPCPADDGTAARTTEFEQAPPICVDEGAVFELEFETPAGSFTLPVDTARDLDAANLAVVLSRYHAYEKTPVTAVASGFLTVGSFGDAGFTIPATPTTDPVEDLYPIGSVVVLADVDDSLSGSLTVVMDDLGRQLMQAQPGHVVIGFIEDLTEIRAVYDAPESAATVLIDTVTVTETT